MASESRAPDPLPVGTTRQERARQTKERVLQAATEIFATRAYDDVQVREIVERAEVAHGVMFHHFTNKRGLYLAAVRSISQRLFDIEKPDETLAPSDRIRALLRNLFSRMAENEELFISYIQNAMTIGADPEARKMLQEGAAPLIDWIYEIAEIPSTAEAPRMLLLVIAASIDRLVLEWLKAGRPYPIETLIEASIEILLGALKAAETLEPSLDCEKGIRALRG